MAKRKSRNTRQEHFPGWAWMLFGLAIGLSVAFAVYMKDSRPPTKARATAQPASLGTAIDEAPPPAREPAKDEPPKEKRFTFYDMLPNFEVIIPEQEPNVRADTEVRPVLEPGTYVLQAGSFTDYADADRRRAELALQGIESRIQRVTIDDRTYHRVRIGPTRDLEKLNLLRSRLRAADIDVLRIRLGD